MCLRYIRAFDNHQAKYLSLFFSLPFTSVALCDIIQIGWLIRVWGFILSIHKDSDYFPSFGHHRAMSHGLFETSKPNITNASLTESCDIRRNGKVSFINRSSSSTALWYVHAFRFGVLHGRNGEKVWTKPPGWVSLVATTEGETKQ